MGAWLSNQVQHDHGRIDMHRCPLRRRLVPRLAYPICLLQTEQETLSKGLEAFDSQPSTRVNHKFNLHGP